MFLSPTGAKRPAVSNSNTTPFTGKGQVLGSGTSSKPTLLQKWIADQRKKQDGSSSSTTSKTKPPAALGAPPTSDQDGLASSSTSKTKPPASLGAPPTSDHSSSTSNSKTKPPSSGVPKPPSVAPTHPKQSTNLDELFTEVIEDVESDEETPLQKWISKNTDVIRKAVSKPSTSTSGEQENKNGNPKHTRKLSGKRKELLAIFESDSDSDDELFKRKPRPKMTPTVGAGPSASTSSSQHPNGSRVNHIPVAHQVPVRDRVSTTPGINNSFNPGSLRLPTAKPLFGNSSSLFTQIGGHDTSRPPLTNSTGSSRVPTSTTPSTSTKTDIPRSKVASPCDPYLSSRVTGAYGGASHRPNTSTGLNGGGLPHTVTGAHTQNPAGSGSGQAQPVKQVQCPVCTMQVAEMDINAHLDMCLT